MNVKIVCQRFVILCRRGISWNERATASRSCSCQVEPQEETVSQYTGLSPTWGDKEVLNNCFYLRPFWLFFFLFFCTVKLNCTDPEADVAHCTTRLQLNWNPSWMWKNRFRDTLPYVMKVGPSFRDSKKTKKTMYNYSVQIELASRVMFYLQYICWLAAVVVFISMGTPCSHRDSGAKFTLSSIPFVILELVIGMLLCLHNLLQN